MPIIYYIALHLNLRMYFTLWFTIPFVQKAESKGVNTYCIQDRKTNATAPTTNIYE